MAFRSAAFGCSLRAVSKKFIREGARRAVALEVFRLTPVTASNLSKSFVTIHHPRISTVAVGPLQARFSSSKSYKCVEHKVENCSPCAKEVSHDELTTLLEHADTIKLVDVREPYELRDTGEIPNSVNIPLTQLKGTLQLESELFQEKTGLPKPTKADSIVFYGMGSIRSVAALEIACKMGYKKARHYPGGWEEWNKINN